jgi:uncharacterized protein YvpB/prefoldin subunit 5
MIRANYRRRRSLPALIWFALGVLPAAVIASVALGLFAWKEAEQIRTLRAKMEAIESDRQSTEAMLVALQSTATVMENRVSTLEANDPAQQLDALRTALETADDSEELAAVRSSMTEIQARLNTFQSTLDDLAARIATPVPGNGEAGAAPPSAARLVVAPQRQRHNLSCESAAASMVAQYYDLDISEADVLSSLPLNDNPHLGFRGNVDGPTGGIEDYGVYAEPIMAVLNSRGLRAWPVTGGLDGIKLAISRGHPVIAWVTYHCLPSTPVETTIGGQTVVLVPNQHVVVVTGYNAEGVWANDPWDGREEFFPFADFGRAMGYFGDMAIAIAVP